MLWDLAQRICRASWGTNAFDQAPICWTENTPTKTQFNYCWIKHQNIAMQNIFLRGPFLGKLKNNSSSPMQSKTFKSVAVPGSFVSNFASRPPSILAHISQETIGKIEFVDIKKLCFQKKKPLQLLAISNFSIQCLISPYIRKTLPYPTC